MNLERLNAVNDQDSSHKRKQRKHIRVGHDLFKYIHKYHGNAAKRRLLAGVPASLKVGFCITASSDIGVFLAASTDAKQKLIGTSFA